MKELEKVLKELNVTTIFNKELGKNLNLDILEEYDQAHRRGAKNRRKSRRK